MHMSEPSVGDTIEDTETGTRAEVLGSTRQHNPDTGNVDPALDVETEDGDRTYLPVTRFDRYEVVEEGEDNAA